MFAKPNSSNDLYQIRLNTYDKINAEMLKDKNSENSIS